MKLPQVKKKITKHLGKTAKVVFWFSVGAALGLFFLLSFALIIFQKLHQDRIYPGVMVNGLDFSGKKQEEVVNYFKEKNNKISDVQLVFTSDIETATVSAKDIDLGYDYNLLATQAYALGRSPNIFSNAAIIFMGYTQGINLPPSYGYSHEKLVAKLAPAIEKLHKKPVDSLFNFQNGRVLEFKPSINGQDADIKSLEKQLQNETSRIISSQMTQTVTIEIPVKITEPDITTDKANSLGIRELLGRGESTYLHSIPGRIFNVNLAASRVTGVLVPPDTEFSFNSALGDVSSFTGYKQAYVILNGKTVLGDGGGVCQVSTTLFRAILEAGLPITERHAHAYRVGYYEQNSAPGVDATVYSPTVDLKFKNDTGHHLLIQSYNDPINLGLVFEIYGTKDGRQVTMSKPVITRQTPAPPDVFQDDPTLPKGEVKQVDFAAAGANVFFTRKVIKDGKVIADDNFVSNYRPWQAIFLRGTKEN